MHGMKCLMYYQLLWDLFLVGLLFHCSRIQTLFQGHWRTLYKWQVYKRSVGLLGNSTTHFSELADPTSVGGLIAGHGECHHPLGSRLDAFDTKNFHRMQNLSSHFIHWMWLFVNNKVLKSFGLNTVETATPSNYVDLPLNWNVWRGKRLKRAKVARENSHEFIFYKDETIFFCLDF
jgi:hypothetical protein